MPRLVWLSLLLGYVAGIAAAVLFLPGPIVEPLYGTLTLGSIVLVGGVSTIVLLAGQQSRAAATATNTARAAGDAAAVATAPAPAVEPEARAPTAAAAPDEPDAVATGEVAADEPDPDEDDGGLSEEDLRRLVDDGRIAIHALPVVALSAPGLELREALPRLRVDADRHLEPAEFRVLAARYGLTSAIDRALFDQCLASARAATADGRHVVLLCSIAASSLDDPAFIATLEAFVEEHAELHDRVVLTVDRVRLRRPAWQALTRLADRGLTLCLRRLTLETIDMAELADNGFGFVKLDAPRYAARSGDDTALPRELRRLRQRFERSVVTLLVDHTGAEPAVRDTEDAIVPPPESILPAPAGRAAPADAAPSGSA